MKALKDWGSLLKDSIPLLTAAIGAIVVIRGYMVQKDLERQAEERKYRQEIYSSIIKNYTERNTPGWGVFSRTRLSMRRRVRN
jgi:hypothetical protein